MPGNDYSQLITVAQSIAQNLNTISATMTNSLGITNQADISAAVLVKSSPGRVVMVSVTTAGSTVGHIYDDSVATSTKRALYAIPNTVGIVWVNMPANYGIVVMPGTGQVVAVSFT